MVSEVTPDVAKLFGLRRVGGVVITIVVTAGMVSTTWVQFLKGSLLVIFSGRIVADLDPKTVTPEELGSYMTGVGVEAAS